MKKETLINKVKLIYTAVFVLFLSAVAVSLAFNSSIWLDEGFSLRWSMLPFSSFVKRITLDVCPLYLIMLRIILTLTGNHLLAAKLFSAAALILILIMDATFIRKKFGLKAMTFFGLFFFCMPMVMKRAVEVRMYTWAFLWVLLAYSQMYFLIEQKQGNKNWILFTVFSLAACYTHYFAVLSLVVAYAGMGIYFLFVKNWKQFRNWILCSGVTIVCYLPWVPIILRQSNSETTSWIPGQSYVYEVLVSMFETGIPRTDKLFLLLCAALSVWGFILFCKHKSTELYWTLLCICSVWCVWIFGIVFELFARPILVKRYLMIPFCATIMGMSSLCKYLNKYITLLLCVFFMLIGVHVYKDVYQEEYGTRANETLQFAKEHFADTDIIATNADSLCSVIPYYFPDSRSIEDIYSDKYNYIWYFDTEQTLDPEKLKETGISYIDYGSYGFDVEFEIYYLYREEGIQ